MEISEGLQFCQVNANFAQISVSLGKFLGEARGETTEHLRIVTQNSIDVEFRMNVKRVTDIQGEASCNAMQCG